MWRRLSGSTDGFWYFKEHDAVSLSSSFEDECEAGKRRAFDALDPRDGGNLRTMIDRHAEYVAVPVGHGIHIGGKQAAVQGSLGWAITSVFIAFSF